MKKMIAYEMRKVQNLMTKSLSKIGKDDKAEKLSMVQVWILEYLYDNIGQDIFQKDIEIKFDITAPTATKMIESLVKRGFLVRESVLYDARLKKILLTEKATKGHEEFLNRIKIFNDKLVKGITVKEQEEFIRILKKLENNLI